MSALPEHYITEQEYLDGERISDIKHEYVAGQVYAMTGASANHNFIVASIIGTSLQALKGKKCKVMPSDMKVSIPRKKSYFYPDVSIVCGDLWIGDQYRDVLLNPTIIFEVLSPSTEAFDRSKKFEAYRSIPSLREYILVAQHRVYIEQYVRQAHNQWNLIIINDIDAMLELISIQTTLSVREIYAQIEFDPASDDDDDVTKDE